ncbi:MAG: cytochrome c biogenesis protein CcsA [Saprospiraceae bacterium]|nr:cytochrome c biogenesis protein CcsA [Saprospiraceae bacterium]MBK7812342.1 cytochrome c biogenesis protein CcsA [Saprospiraceae bacterium]MBK9632433.1 cytochrome c biogenesis protein CcsA [Saprospiraceae bacterium]
MRFLGLAWWKWMSIVLFVYVITRGLLVPLKPGILNINPSRFQVGQSVEFEIEGYNSFYTKATPRVFFKISDQYLCRADSIEVISETKLKIKHLFHNYLPVNQKIVMASVIVDSEVDGASVMPSKLILSQDSIELEEGIAAWTLDKPAQFNLKHKYHFPFRNILYETIRNTFFHVSLWFGMFALMFGSLYYSYRVLKYSKPEDDLRAYSMVYVAVIFGVLGLMTGSLWARFTWDTWWTNDIKLNMAALSMLIYIAYLILRASIDDPDRRAKITAAYNVFAVVAIIPLIFVLPRLTDSLHPGNGGNPAFGSDDMDNALRTVFYPSVTAFILLGFWMADLWKRVCVLDAQDSLDFD